MSSSFPNKHLWVLAFRFMLIPEYVLLTKFLLTNLSTYILAIDFSSNVYFLIVPCIQIPHSFMSYQLMFCYSTSLRLVRFLSFGSIKRPKDPTHSRVL